MASTKMKLHPFTVPNFVICDMPSQHRQAGFVESPKFALHELDDETLLEMCEDFKLAVMKKARDARSSETTDGSMT